MTFLHRLPAALLLLTILPACGPKDDADEETGDEAGTTTTGDDGVTTGDSDPTSPATMSSTGNSGTATTAATGTASTGTSTVSSTSTTGEDPTVGSTDPSTTTTDPTVGTSTSTTATATSTTSDPSDTDDPVDLPIVPCEGAATPLVGITTKIGYLQSQLPPRMDPTGGSSGSSGGDELDPGTLFVRLSDQSFTCADPNGPVACGPHWDVTIVIPPEFQSPGVHNLLGQNVRGYASETGTDEGMNECSFGIGTFGATFEILAIDDDVVEGRLCNVDGLFIDTNPQLEGSFTATLCPL